MFVVIVVAPFLLSSSTVADGVARERVYYYETFEEKGHKRKEKKIHTHTQIKNKRKDSEWLNDWSPYDHEKRKLI